MRQSFPALYGEVMTKAELEAKVLELEKKIAVLEAHRCETHVHYHTHQAAPVLPLRGYTGTPYIGDPIPIWPTTAGGTVTSNVPPFTVS